MNIQPIGTKIISTLGNKESLIPIMIKDGVDSAGLTYKSYKCGGIVEGTDRAIDEFGTEALWIGGIPFFKFLIDKTIYKAAKINPQVDPRIIADKEYSQWALKNAKGIMNNSKIQSVKSVISKCLEDEGKLAKNLYKTKIIIATALTLISFFSLTKFKQNNTKNTVEKNIEEEKTNKQEPAFKGIGSNIAEKIMFNPVHNMKIIDAGITGERLICSRSKIEFFEHAIKEGGFLFFIYGFGNLIEKGINKFCEKVIKIPIELPIDVLSDNFFEKSLNGNNIINNTNLMPNISAKLSEKLNFIITNKDNIIIKSAQKAKIIGICEDKCGNKHIDTSKYIDIKELEKFIEDLKNFDTAFKNSNTTAQKFLSKAKALKVLSVLANIGISCLFLGFIIPKLIYTYRKYKTGTTKFHVEEDIKRNKTK